MEFSFNVFWIIKLAFMVAALFSIYRSVKAEFKSYLWNVLSVAFILIGIFTPIRMEQANLNRVHSTEINLIEESKALPEMVTDNSFAKKVAEPKEITKEQIWDEK